MMVCNGLLSLHREKEIRWLEIGSQKGQLSAVAIEAMTSEVQLSAWRMVLHLGYFAHDEVVVRQCKAS